MCAKVCPSNSKKVSGEIKTIDEVLAVVKKDHAFYRHSGGGITVGGGEMLAQPEFVCELLSQSREMGLDTAIETSGHGSLEWLLRIADQCDTIHYDIKAADPALHKELTGVDNQVILNNLRALSAYLSAKTQKRPRLILRLPLMKGYNTEPGEVRRIAELITRELPYYSLTEVLAFHNFGGQKYEELGMDYEFANYPNNTKADLEEAIGILQEYHLKLKVPKW